MPLEPEPVILGDLSFEASVRRLGLSLSMDLPRPPVERGADMADRAFLVRDSVARRSLGLFQVYTQSFRDGDDH